jgi:hypothetical protein
MQQPGLPIQRSCYPYAMSKDPPDIGDISSADELIRYAVRAQLALVSEAASHNTIAKAIGMARDLRTSTAPASLSRALTGGTFADTKLQKLDEVIVALAPVTTMHAGGLSSFAICLRGLRDRESLSNRVRASWTQEILQKPADDEFGVLTQASALLSAFLAAEEIEKANPKSTAVRSLRDRYAKEITHVVDQLIMLAYAPPTPRSVEALIVLGSLGGYALNIVRESLQDALMHPLGFRVWRVITTLVLLNKRASRALLLRDWSKYLLGQAEGLRGQSIYPARSLDLELAISIPSGWSPPEDDWAGEALIGRAANPDATNRERGTAVTGLWQRAMAYPLSERQSSAARLEALLSRFESEDANSDVHHGIRWIATTLRQVIKQDVEVCNEWPEVSGSWMQHVKEAVGYLEGQAIPHDVLPGTKTLFQHSLLQNAGVYRRQAIEALVAGGWTGPVARALERFLELETEESWIRIRALFALGFLQHRNRNIAHCLSASCHHAYSNLKDNSTDTARIAEMHAALFAVGDCFGATEVPEEDVGYMREGIREVLTELVSSTVTTRNDLYPVSRACAYLLTFMILPREGQTEDLAETLLKELSRHPDSITRQLSSWALRNRLNESGQVRQLVHARVMNEPLQHLALPCDSLISSEHLYNRQVSAALQRGWFRTCRAISIAPAMANLS